MHMHMHMHMEGRSESGSLEARYERDGCVFPVTQQLGSPEAVDGLDALCTRLVAGRPPTLAPEDLLNLHYTVPAMLAACRHPALVGMARRLLGVEAVSIFTSRILCKAPRTGKAIAWHQDSNYWPLIPPGGERVAPRVASVWLALDDVGLDNGPVYFLPFPAQPDSDGRNVEELVLDAGGGTDGFDNFNLSLDATRLNEAGAVPVLLERGDASWHGAWTIHRSDTNASDRRRLAFIVRYVPTGTRVAGGVRGSFDESYDFVPASGPGSDETRPPAAGDAYAPCFGKSAAALNK